MTSPLMCRFLSKIKNKRLVLLLVGLVFAPACMQIQNSSSGDEEAYANVDGGPEFQTVRTIIQRSCAAPCHTYSGYTEAQFIAEGLVVAQNPEGSKMYYRLSGSTGANGPKTMPQNAGSLTAAELDAFKTWINTL